MGVNDALCVRLERENTELLAEVKRLVNLPAAVQQPNWEALRERIIEHILLDSNSVDKVEHILEWEPRNPQLLKAHRLADAILAALPIPATGEVEWSRKTPFGDIEAPWAEADARARVAEVGGVLMCRTVAGPWVEVTP